jgi:nucleotide-binding universal stress UspA family protein
MKMMIALDNSEYAFKALREAVSMTKKEGAELTIFSVYADIVEVGEFSVGVHESMIKQAEEIVAKGKAIAEQSDVKVKIAIEGGVSAADNIVRFAEKNHIELIVMGHKSRKGLDRLLVGSVAAKVVTYAPCSVLIIR